jgi:hypothetical protein
MCILSFIYFYYTPICILFGALVALAIYLSLHPRLSTHRYMVLDVGHTSVTSLLSRTVSDTYDKCQKYLCHHRARVHLELLCSSTSQATYLASACLLVFLARGCRGWVPEVLTLRNRNFRVYNF